jgi:hypothetical protein
MRWLTVSSRAAFAHRLTSGIQLSMLIVAASFMLGVCGCDSTGDESTNTAANDTDDEEGMTPETDGAESEGAEAELMDAGEAAASNDEDGMTGQANLDASTAADDDSVSDDDSTSSDAQTSPSQSAQQRPDDEPSSSDSPDETTSESASNPDDESQTPDDAVVEEGDDTQMPTRPAVEASPEDPADVPASATVVDCDEDRFSADSTIQHSLVGANGQFTDRCTEDGNLEQFFCGATVDLGDVEVYEVNPIPYLVDCDGRCVDGTCESSCPEHEQQIQVNGINDDNKVSLDNLSDGRAYACMFLSGDLEACVHDPGGAVGVISGLGGAGGGCEGGPIGNIRVAFEDGSECTYSNCRIDHQDGLPDPPAPVEPVTAPTEIDCENPDSMVVHVGIPATLSGSNGTFADECTPEGDLIQYACEIETECTGRDLPTCTDFPTGVVVSTEVPCGGRCSAGACEYGCPTHWQRVTVIGEQADGRYLLSDAELQRDFLCELGEDNPDDDFDCARTAEAVGFITLLGLSGEASQYTCTAGVIGSMGLCFDSELTCAESHCTYEECVVVP